MKKLICVLGILVAMPAFADDDAPTVAARKTCAEIKAEIDAIGTAQDPDTDALEKLNSQYRAQCVKRTAGRRNHVAFVTTQPENIDSDDVSPDDIPNQSVDDMTSPSPDDVATSPDTVSPSDTDAPETFLTPDEIDAFLAAGLCEDGTKPNRFGCCSGEVFKDLGHNVYACCPREGDAMCYPPIK